MNQTQNEPTDGLNTLRDAFSQLTPVREDYPLLPIEHGFNWDECTEGLQIPQLYLVVFRSIRRVDADVERLRWFDDRAFDDASQAPGFLFYFKGQATPGRACLSFCLWKTRQLARSASDRPAHAEAASLVAEMYETYDLERHRLYARDARLVFERLPG